MAKQEKVNNEEIKEEVKEKKVKKEKVKKEKVKKDKKTKNKAQRDYDKTQIVVKIVAAILAFLMVISVAGTLLYSLI